MERSTSVLLAALGLVLSSFARNGISPTSDLVTRTRLSAPTELQGYPCAAGYAWLFFDGRLRECAVSRGIAFGDTAIPAESWINLTHEGNPDFVFLAHDTPVDGYICKGGGPLGPTEGAATALYPSGRLKTCWLAADTVVDGTPCMHASMLADAFGGGSGTDFHENGRLQSCKLSRSVVIGDHAFRQGDHIRLDAHGKLALLPPAHPR